MVAIETVQASELDGDSLESRSFYSRGDDVRCSSRCPIYIASICCELATEGGEFDALFTLPKITNNETDYNLLQCPSQFTV